MQSCVWVRLLRQIPAERQNNLMLVTACGTEIAIQAILRIDPEFVAIKGRLAGSQDAGRVFFLPFTNIDYFGFQNELKESDFQEMFASLDFSPPDESAMEMLPEPPPGPIQGPIPPTTPSSIPSAAPTGRQAVPIKSTILERFRSRSATNAGTSFRPPVDE
jgi:hypothetical protein